MAPMSTNRPSDKDLDFVGFTELQIILLRDLPDHIVTEAYYRQLENLMSDNEETIDF